MYAAFVLAFGAILGAVNGLLGHENRVGMTNRPKHEPTEESNARIDEFFEWALKR